MIFETLKQASAVAHATVAAMQGMTPGGTNAIYLGKNYVVAFGVPIVIEIPVVGGGYRRRVEIPASITRDQLSITPISKEKIVRTDGAAQVTYIIDAVLTHDPFRWHMVLVKLGE